MDLVGRRRRAGRDTLIAVLRALGAPVEGRGDVADALRERREEVARRLVEPVTVAWSGRVATARLTLPPRRAVRRVGCRLELEDGSVRTWRVDVASLPTFELDLPGPLPPGYHRLEVEVAGASATSLVIRAPLRAADPLPPGSWGVFAPVHALHRRGSWGVGDLSDLGALLGSVREYGANLVGTLPLYAAFLREPAEPSPYSPVSRLFWNEQFLDVEALPEVRADAAARRLLGSTALRRELDRLRSGDLVDHGAVMAAKRRVLELAARGLLAEPSTRRDALEAFARERPGLDDYARFRAAGERWGRDWRAWPGPPRDGRLRAADVDPEAVGYHRFVQWAAEEQIASLARSDRAALYLDLPLGAHPDGYDVWRERDAFALGVSAGAPPDDFFPGGQDWGIPPPHPAGIREQGYRHQIACVRHAMRHAGAIRVDHVMGLHRLYWVPHGLPADRGAYVRYRPNEWYAILALESHRAGVAVVGEDLGTVPLGVRGALRRHGILRSHVLQMAADPDRTPPLPEAPAASLASLNTHDMPPFAAFWRGTDVDQRVELGLLREEEAAEERSRRARIRGSVTAQLRAEGRLPGGSAHEDAILSACLGALAGSRARGVMVNLEDLWGETRAQNVPGVVGYPSWRRRTAHPLDVALGLPEVVDRLRLVGTLRRDAASPGRMPRAARRP